MNKTQTWSQFLRGASIMNIAIWVYVFFMCLQGGNANYIQAGLSAIYVGVCAFRSFYPRVDLERYCLHDSPLSSIALGRSLATLAEITFSIQCAIIIYQLGVFIEAPWIVIISYLVVPIIVLAQVFCWYATLTINHVWHGLEELAWVVMIVLAGACLIAGFGELSGSQTWVMSIGLIACLASLYVMLAVDVPMYFSRAKEARAAGVATLTMHQGIQDSLRRRIQTYDWRIWKKEVLWMSSYFTLGVWLSIAMMLVNFTP